MSTYVFKNLSFSLKVFSLIAQSSFVLQAKCLLNEAGKVFAAAEHGCVSRDTSDLGRFCEAVIFN